MSASSIGVAQRVLEQRRERADVHRGDVTEARIVSSKSISPLLSGCRREAINRGVIHYDRPSSTRHQLCDCREVEGTLDAHRAEIEQIPVGGRVESPRVKEPLSA